MPPASIEAVTVVTVTVIAAANESYDVSTLVDWAALWVSAAGLSLTAITVMGGFLAVLGYKNFGEFKKELKKDLQEDVAAEVEKAVKAEKHNFNAKSNEEATRNIVKMIAKEMKYNANSTAEKEK